MQVKLRDLIEAISEIESGIGPEKLFLANERFYKLPNLHILTIGWYYQYSAKLSKNPATYYKDEKIMYCLIVQTS